MRQRSRGRHKGRKQSGTFTLIPHAVQDSPNWRRCSGTAIKLLCDLARQYNGKNNGDLCAARSILKPLGWTSPDTLHWALQELRHYGLLKLTRQGGLRAPNLYALTWYPIDACNGKLNHPSTAVASGDWKELCETFKRQAKKRNASTESVSTCYVIRSYKAKEAA